MTRHFNLDDVLAGAPIQTVSGEPREFVEHVPRAAHGFQLLILNPEDGTVDGYTPTGGYQAGQRGTLDLVSGIRPSTNTPTLNGDKHAGNRCYE
jgi:hypothetical protein